MDKRALGKFKKSLEMKRDELQLRLSSAKEQGRDSSISESEGDRANASIATEMSAAQQTRVQSALKAVNAALERVESGTFGDCIHCDQEISARRLGAVPWTRYCITCQELINGR